MKECLSATKYNMKEITLVEKIKYILLYGTKKNVQSENFN